MNNKQKQSGFAHLGILLFVIVVAVIGFIGWSVVKKNKQSSGLDGANSANAVEKGKYLSNGQCSGEGSKQLTHAPMDKADIGVIVPYGLMITDHVTPVDHQYYYQKNLTAAKDTYNVYAPADGTIVGVEHHGDDSSREERWRIVISYSCTFLSYYDLMTDFSLQSQLPQGWSPDNSGDVNIPVKAGDVVGKVGGQSLDFAVWDTSKLLSGFLHPIAYNNREPWKNVTASPLDYFTEAVKQQILPLYVGDQTVKDGRIDFDVDGKAVGTWFLEGTNGYAGSTDPRAHEGHQGHLTLGYDNVDSSALTVSVGNYLGSPTQFAVVGNQPDFSYVSQANGLVKYQLAARSFVTGGGDSWNGATYAADVSMVPGKAQATLLIQLTESQKMKVEFFPNKTPEEVNGFTGNAQVYDRGQDAVMLPETRT